MEDSYEIEIIEVNIIDGGIEVFARAWCNGIQIGFGKDGSVDIERFRIFNPPILVQDVNGSIVNEFTHPITGELTSIKYREDPEEAILSVIVHNASVVGVKNSTITPGKIGNTTDTFYPNADTESTSVDGYSGRAPVPAENFSTIVSGAGNESGDSQIYAHCRLSMGTSAGTYVELVRAFYLFDTSSIPDTDNIDSATLSVYGYIKSETGGIPAQSMNIYSSNPASNTAISNSDYSQVGTTALCDTAITVSAFNTSNYNDFTLNSSGLSVISKTGISKFSRRYISDATNTEPTWSINGDSYAFSYTADQAGTANDPKLVVVHSAGAPSVNSNFFALM